MIWCGYCAVSTITSVLAAVSLPFFVVIFIFNMIAGQQTYHECLELGALHGSVQSSFDGTCQISLRATGNEIEVRLNNASSLIAIACFAGAMGSAGWLGAKISGGREVDDVSTE